MCELAAAQVVKHEWPHRWPSFISDLTGAAKISEVMCENCMNILKLLSEEVFDFSRGEMTQAKTRDLKESLNKCVSYPGAKSSRNPWLTLRPLHTSQPRMLVHRRHPPIPRETPASSWMMNIFVLARSPVDVGCAGRRGSHAVSLG